MGQILIPKGQEAAVADAFGLPEKWDGTLQGLAYTSQEQIGAACQAVHELQRAGYIVRSRERDSRGQLRDKDCRRLLSVSLPAFLGGRARLFCVQFPNLPLWFVSALWGILFSS